MLPAAILHECQNYVGGGSGLGGGEKEFFLFFSPLPPRATIPDARPLGTVYFLSNLHNKNKTLIRCTYTFAIEAIFKVELYHVYLALAFLIY